MNFINHLQSASSELDIGENSFEEKVGAYLPEEFRSFIEENFYQKISEQSRLEKIIQDPSFLKNPTKHIALFTDHGVVHVRDVALQMLEVIDRVNGLLIPKRENEDLEFLKGFGLLIAYLHDIGMSEFSAYGRFMHPEFAAQFVFDPRFDEILDLLCAKDVVHIPATIHDLFGEHQGEKERKIIFREILALSIGHSKSKMPMDILNHPESLRTHMLGVLSKNLEFLYYEQKIERFSKAQNKAKKLKRFEKKRSEFIGENEELSNPHYSRFYTNPSEESYKWLLDPSDSGKKFILNIQDTIRCLRAADALRQRGTVLRTSAGYEIFADRKTANAIYALRNNVGDRLYLLESKKALNAGEANIASSEIDPDGNLRISLHLGGFASQKVTNKAARNAALVIDDIQADTIKSFDRNGLSPNNFFPEAKLGHKDINILIEQTEDNPNFSDLICKAFTQYNPKAAQRISTTFSLHGLEVSEVDRYLSGEPLVPYMQAMSMEALILENFKRQGYSFPDQAFIPGSAYIKVLHLSKGEVLVKAGSKSGFVYFPMSEGLRVHPLGGYESSAASPWVPLGNTGVIRASIRNAHIVSEKTISLICVPKNIYLKHWYQPLSAKDLADMEW
ncbi:MAG: hypothetical protein AAFR87_16660 [Bacteroidota bacterium]